MDILSRNLVEATIQAKKARWTFDGAVRGKASQLEQTELWNTYKSIETSVSQIQSCLERIGLVKQNVVKARWWLDVGVYMDTSLGLIYPLDSQDILKMRLDSAVEKAQEDFDKAVKEMDILVASVKTWSDPWLEQERARLATQAQQEQANALYQETKQIRQWCDYYLLREQQLYDQKRVKLEAEVQRTVTKCKQKVREIKTAVRNRSNI